MKNCRLGLIAKLNRPYSIVRPTQKSTVVENAKNRTVRPTGRKKYS
jgi:hypothetical protein